MTDPTIIGTLEAPTRRGDPFTVVVVCPHCGAEHTHGAGMDGTVLGHRRAHCGRGGYTIEAG